MTGDENGPGRRPSERVGDDRGADDRGADDRGADDRGADDSGAGGRGVEGMPGATVRGDRGLRGLPRERVGETLAPVIPLFGGRDRSVAAHPSVRGGRTGDDIHDSTGGLGARRTRLRPLRDVGDARDAARVHGRHDEAESHAAPTDDLDAVGTAELREKAEAVLLRKLRSRSLSLSEARATLRATDGVDELIVGEVIDRFVDLGYLDDATFAEQLVMTAVEKKGEGRRAVAETMRKRGIPRDIAEAALSALPDDDAERALEFARSKVRGVEGVEYDAALRRLGGQLARRGYPSSVALTAARTALEEVGIGRSRPFARPASGVRFTPDE